MCISCGCWTDTSGTKGGDGAHQENSTVMPNVPTTKSPLSGTNK